MDVEAANTAFKLLALVATGVTFLLGAGALWTEVLITRTQRAELARLAKELATAQTGLAEQQARAASAEMDLLALQTKLSPRVLTPEQQERIAAEVKPFAGLVFEIMTYPGDAEPAALAKTITSVLTAAGWELRPVKGTLLGSATGLVVTVIREADEKQREAAATLVSALNTEGITAALAVGALKIGVTIKIQVAKKP